MYFNMQVKPCSDQSQEESEIRRIIEPPGIDCRGLGTIIVICG